MRRTDESILDERERVVRDFGNELNPLRLRSVIDTSLQHTTSVSVSTTIESSATSQRGEKERNERDFDAVRSHGVVNELVVLRRKVVETLLNDVVTVEICEAKRISKRKERGKDCANP